MLPQRGSFWFLYSTFFVISTADQIVRLERTPYSTWEPYFNPQIVNANVGELITFVANFSDQSFKSTVRHLMKISSNFLSIYLSFGRLPSLTIRDHVSTTKVYILKRPS